MQRLVLMKCGRFSTDLIIHFMTMVAKSSMKAFNSSGTGHLGVSDAARMNPLL